MVCELFLFQQLLLIFAFWSVTIIKLLETFCQIVKIENVTNFSNNCQQFFATIVSAFKFWYARTKESAQFAVVEQIFTFGGEMAQFHTMEKADLESIISLVF